MNLFFYTVDEKYCEFLRKIDFHVPYIKNEKSKRPFIGVVFKINSMNYYAPLTSPKPKHLKMKNQDDFLKIDSGRLGAINLNNMIPIHNTFLTKVNVKVFSTDTKETINYKNLLINQLSWCNSNKEKI
ncbi:type III toxin-antitoxin system ToxN/AbiQ family toxin, partial [Defluviitalea phaphyphila]|uniref:type III toxin-antitoxin system ToxN/AbiQ family toxin n=1 Tax=Defluviitalea phaphyphila TaxID=1473580 RepID=UPI001FA7296B